MDTLEVMTAARELYDAGNYSSVVAVCTEVLAEDQRAHEVRLLLAQALLVLRQDDQAHKHLDECLREHQNCAASYELLGRLAFRRDQLKEAELFFRESLRLNPESQHAQEWLAIVTGMEGQAKPARQRDRSVDPKCRQTVSHRPPTRYRTVSHPGPRRRAPTLSFVRGFGRYLVEVGVLTPAQLHETIAYHRSTGTRVGRAAIELGFASAPKVEWAALAYHSRRPLY